MGKHENAPGDKGRPPSSYGLTENKPILLPIKPNASARKTPSSNYLGTSEHDLAKRNAGYLRAMTIGWDKRLIRWVEMSNANYNAFHTRLTSLYPIQLFHQHPNQYIPTGFYRYDRRVK